MPARTDLNARVVVDMTPLEPGGQNGGAGLVATSLVRGFSALAPEARFTLLTSSSNHVELAQLDAPNVHRECVVTRSQRQGLVRLAFDRIVPVSARARLKHAYFRVRTARRYRASTSTLSADLLFCPFTVPYFWRAGTPCVSIVYDLQHLTYPEFFSEEQRFNRQRHIVAACERSEHVVCISDYVRRTLLANVPIAETRASTIHLGLLDEFTHADLSILDSLGVRGQQFLLYPANFWPHKNHATLFEAVRRYRNARPGRALRLVLTGASNALMRELQSTVDRDETFVFAGYVSTAALAALLDASLALVFPSLYEGFGMPVLEAMACGRPVLCSNVTSLPEVAGDAAVYFDPVDAADIARAIGVVLDDPASNVERVRRGQARAAQFGDASSMAERYLQLFRATLSARAC